jgi:ankyrin repeat protein
MNTPLTYAIQKENIEIIKILIEHGADINCKSKPLLLAIKKENIEIIKILIENNVSVKYHNFIFIKNKEIKNILNNYKYTLILKFFNRIINKHNYDSVNYKHY